MKECKVCRILQCEKEGRKEACKRNLSILSILSAGVNTTTPSQGITTKNWQTLGKKRKMKRKEKKERKRKGKKRKKRKKKRKKKEEERKHFELQPATQPVSLSRVEICNRNRLQLVA